MKLLLIAAITLLASCSKEYQRPAHATVTAKLVYLFPGADGTPQAQSSTYLPSDSVTMEYKGVTYKTGITVTNEATDTSIHILCVKDVNGVVIDY